MSGRSSRRTGLDPNSLGLMIGDNGKPRVEKPKPKPSKIRRTFRWIWRLTYLSVGGLIGYTCYIIYLDRNPEPQFEQDPNKKTLVILGRIYRNSLYAVWEDRLANSLN